MFFSAWEKCILESFEFQQSGGASKIVLAPSTMSWNATTTCWSHLTIKKFACLPPNLFLMRQGILKGELSLYCWPPVWLVWNQLYVNWQFLFYLQNRLIQTSQTGGQRYSDTFPFNIPWMRHLSWCYCKPCRSNGMTTTTKRVLQTAVSAKCAINRKDFCLFVLHHLSLVTALCRLIGFELCWLRASTDQVSLLFISRKKTIIFVSHDYSNFR